MFRLNVSFVWFLGPEECFSGEGWDRSLNSSVHMSNVCVVNVILNLILFMYPSIQV